MAKTIGYYEDFETSEAAAEAYSEGPFVVCSCFGDARIEVENKNGKCPCLPYKDIYALCELYNKPCHKSSNFQEIRDTVDWLNEQVKIGVIICHERGYWYVK